MKRFKVTTLDGKTLKLYYNSITEAQSYWQHCIIEEFMDDSYMEYINQIISQGKMLGYDYRNRPLYKISTNTGVVLVKLMKDNNMYYDNLLYQIIDDHRITEPILWDITTPKTFCEEILKTKTIKWNVILYRKWGQPKLTKPKNLSGVKKDFSAVFIPNHCSCDCFVVGNDLYIKHKDYFSPIWKPPIDDFGKSQDYYCNKYFGGNKKSKFIYSDNWGSIVLRSEAWIKVENIVDILRTKNISQCTQILIDALNNSCGFKVTDTTWERFFEDIYKKVNQ